MNDISNQLPKLYMIGLEQDIAFVHYLKTKCILYAAYGGTDGVGKPKKGASRLRSYLEGESFSHKIRLVHKRSTLAGSDGTRH